MQRRINSNSKIQSVLKLMTLYWPLYWIPCEHCGLMIPIRRKERHIQQAHVNPEDRKYKCDHCGKGFTDRQKLNDHINTHTGERPYICKYCGKGFANHGNQRAHIRQAHLGQKRNYRK